MATEHIRFFEAPLAKGWVYPCSLDDVAQRLAGLPEQDLSGIWAVGLVPSTRKHCASDGRYYFGKQPAIYLYSYSDALTFKLAAHTKRRDIERDLAVQLRFGMQINEIGSRYVCVWNASNLRNFILNHVLLHEVGHHVFFWTRMKQGMPYTPTVGGAEAFADDYVARNYNHR